MLILFISYLYTFRKFLIYIVIYMADIDKNTLVNVAWLL